jgi:glycosyltransferase involved in cell wall biosynthesis
VVHDPDVSVVIPLKDEELNVEPLLDELTGVMGQIGVPYEVILVDDGSTDGTFARLVRAQETDAALRVIRFTRNFGQTAAFAAGFAHARGRYIITSDGDLQNDPTDIPYLLQIARRKDVVCGWRKHRRDAFLTRHVPSVVANWLISLVSGVKLHDNGCSLKIFRAEVVTPLRLRPGMHRYLPALASQLGGRVAEVSVNHRPRRFGRSKYGLSRTFTVVRDLFALPRLMREVTEPSAPAPKIYEIAEVREAPRGTETEG